jgi:hypothetical protein
LQASFSDKNSETGFEPDTGADFAAKPEASSLECLLISAFLLPSRNSSAPRLNDFDLALICDTVVSSDFGLENPDSADSDGLLPIFLSMRKLTLAGK